MRIGPNAAEFRDECASIHLDGTVILGGGPDAVIHPEHEHVEAQVTFHSEVFAADPQAAPGRAWVVPAKAPHSGGWKDGTFSTVFHLTRDFMNVIAEDLLTHSGYELIGGETVDPLILQLGNAAAGEIRVRRHGRLFLDSMSHVLAGHLIRHHARMVGRPRAAGGALTPGQIRRLRQFIEERLDQSLGVADLAGALQLGPQRLTRVLKLSTGFSPYAYVTHLRIERARRLLKNPTLTIAEVAFQLAFASQSHFTAVFRRFVKVTPKAYRNHILKGLNSIRGN